ncbi:uncharacterized protein [Diabrotica undecimpunctata]|uniref:uncharacterized protein n=1 Tax=Diabrotica undecimpunctata TaxID=50387 RepID=UPI003B63DCE8
MQDLKHSGRISFIDNFYTSVKLLSEGKYVCGTLRSNRKWNPKDVCAKKLKKGHIYGEQNENGVRVLKWVNKRQVLMISTVPHQTDKQIPSGRKNRQGEEVLKPPAIIEYNQAKKGVDISDQMSSYYTCLRKTLKWYKKVIFEIILGTCVFNAWVIHSSHNEAKNKLDMLRFREKLIQGLLSDTEEIATKEIRVVHDVSCNRCPRKRSRSSHRLGKYEGNARKSRKRCSNC